MSFGPYPWTRTNTSNSIAGQSESTYTDYLKIKGFEDVGYFLKSYVVNGGVTTANAMRNDTIDATGIVVSLNNDIMARDGYSFQTSIPSTTYYLDFAKEGDWSWGTAHPTGTSEVDYLPVAEVVTDPAGLVSTITDVRGEVGGFRLQNDSTITSNVVDLFAMSGQSNMQGQSEAAPAPFEIATNKAYEYKLLTNALTTVKHPFGEDIDDLLLAAVSGWGSLSPKFAESYYNTTGIPPLMVGVAKGATSISDWIGNARYAKVVEKVNGAVAKATASDLIVRNKCFVWLQGENDGVINTVKQTYKQRLLTLWSNLKRDCGFDKFMIIRVAKYFDYNVTPIIIAQEELAREHDDIIMLTRVTGTFTTVNGLMQSHWHYTNAGYDLAGNTAAAAAGKYITKGVRPTLEPEPYPEAAIAAAGKYEFKYRSGTTAEADNKLTVTAIGTPVINPTYLELDGASGFKLSKGMSIEGDATLSITGLFSTPLNLGGLFTSYDGNINSDFIFFYIALGQINLGDPTGAVAKFFETNTILPELSKYNNYVFQKVGRVYSLYFNNSLIQTIYNGPQVMNINTLFYGLSSLCIKGRLKHTYINIGGVIPPKECDPLFYSGGEQGTT